MAARHDEHHDGGHEPEKPVRAPALLVPYFGACIHVPPPSSNRIVYVKTVAGCPLKELFDPVWVTGEIRTEAHPNEVGDAGYTMQATIIEPYRRPLVRMQQSPPHPRLAKMPPPSPLPGEERPCSRVPMSR